MHEKQQTSVPTSGPEDRRPKHFGVHTKRGMSRCSPRVFWPVVNKQISLRFTPFTPAELRVKDTRYQSPTRTGVHHGFK